MSPKQTFLFLSSALLLALPVAPATAQTYLEAAGGASRGDVDCAGTTLCDRSSSFGRLTLGHEFMPGVAAELSVGQWGTLKVAGNVPGVGNVQAQVKARGTGVGIASSLALNQDWALTARLGLGFNEARISSTAFGATARRSDRNTAPYAGVGLRYRVNGDVLVGVQVDATRIESEGEKANLTMAGAFLRFDF